MNDTPAPPKGRRRGRLRLLLGATFAMVLAAATVTLAGPAQAATRICSNQNSSSGGTYYQMWSNGQGSACMTLNSSSSYSTSWSGIGDFVAGVGWQPGSTQSVTYSGSLNASGGTSLLTLYGWSTNPLIEYYVIEDYTGSPPTQGTNMGTMTSDGSTYTIIKHQQVNQPSIQGNTTFWQYIAIRNSRRSSGTITFQNFVNAWASHGMNLGSMNYQIMATEAWGGGSGSSNVTVSHGGGGGGGGTGGGGGGTGGGGDGTCSVSVSAGQSWSDRFNVNFSVSGSNDWVVTINTHGSQSLQNSWNASISGTSGTLTARPNGNGNNFGITLYKNGNSTMPTASCSSGSGGGGGGGGGSGGGGTGGGGGCSVSVSAGQSWSDRFNVNFSVSGSSNWTVTIYTHGSQSLQNSWNASISGTSGTLTARPNGNGNNFGITLYKNGNSTMPTASCSA